MDILYVHKESSLYRTSAEQATVHNRSRRSGLLSLAPNIVLISKDCSDEQKELALYRAKIGLAKVFYEH